MLLVTSLIVFLAEKLAGIRRNEEKQREETENKYNICTTICLIDPLLVMTTPNSAASAAFSSASALPSSTPPTLPPSLSSSCSRCSCSEFQRHLWKKTCRNCFHPIEAHMGHETHVTSTTIPHTKYVNTIHLNNTSTTKNKNKAAINTKYMAKKIAKSMCILREDLRILCIQSLKYLIRLFVYE